jgi:hypothetical protein
LKESENGCDTLNKILKEANMRPIDADKLKEKLLQMQKDIANGIVSRGNSKSDIWKTAYLLIFDEYIKMLDEMPRVTSGCDADAILDAYGKGYRDYDNHILYAYGKGYRDYDNHILYAYGKGYEKGREDALSEVQQTKDYFKNDCNAVADAILDAYGKGYDPYDPKEFVNRWESENGCNTLNKILKEAKDEEQRND